MVGFRTHKRHYCQGSKKRFKSSNNRTERSLPLSARVVEPALTVQHVVDIARLQDIELMQDIEEDAHDAMPEQNPDDFVKNPSDLYLCFQEKLDMFSVSAPLRPGTVTVDGMDKKIVPFWEDYVDLFHLLTDLELSDEHGNKVLNKFQSVLRRHDFSIPLPKLAKSIRLCIERQACNLYKHTEVTYRLPPLFFKSDDVFARGQKIDVLELCAEQLLRLGPAKIHLNPLKLFSENGDVVVREPASAKRYEIYYDMVKEKYGPDFYPLCIMISGDGLFLNKTGSACATPWYCQVANMTHVVYLNDGSLDFIWFSQKYMVRWSICIV